VYVQEEEGYIKCYRIVGGNIDSVPVAVSTVWSHSPYVGMAISSDGGKGGSGILWETTGWQTDPAVKGTLRALDASDITHELWNSDLTGGSDRLGTFAKFASPTVANGKVYVPTWDNAVVVYGLMWPQDQ
jgi:outer membrane protein assembly factor BamB